jgi:D-cysteine desulfhydrase
VSAGLELAEQIRAGVLPAPARVVVPLGSGGTMAGIVLGLRLAGLATVVEGILVTDIFPPSPRALARRARATLGLLRRLDPDVPDVPVVPADFPIDASQLGPGYGAVTEAARDAVQIAGRAGLRLETTYTGKALAAVLARLRDGTLGDGPVVFWNTFNAVDLQAPTEPSPGVLPPRLRRVLGM